MGTHLIKKVLKMLTKSSDLSMLMVYISFLIHLNLFQSFETVFGTSLENWCYMGMTVCTNWENGPGAVDSVTSKTKFSISSLKVLKARRELLI